MSVATEISLDHVHALLLRLSEELTEFKAMLPDRFQRFVGQAISDVSDCMCYIKPPSEEPGHSDPAAQETRAASPDRSYDILDGIPMPQSRIDSERQIAQAVDRLRLSLTFSNDDEPENDNSTHFEYPINVNAPDEPLGAGIRTDGHETDHGLELVEAEDEDPEQEIEGSEEVCARQCLTLDDFDRTYSALLDEINREDPSFVLDERAPARNDDDGDGNGDGDDGDSAVSLLDSAFEGLYVVDSGHEPVAGRDSTSASMTSTILDFETWDSFSALLRTAAFARRQKVPSPERPLVSILDALIARIPPTAPLLLTYLCGHHRRVRKIEISVPEKFRLTKIVFLDNLGDLAEKLTYSHFLLGKATTNVDELSKDVLEQAFEGKLEGGGGQPLGDDGRATVHGVQNSMNHQKVSAREADIERHFFRGSGELLTEALNKVPVPGGYYMRNGNSALKQDIESDLVPGVRATTDIDDIYDDSPESGVEMKGKLDALFLVQLLGGMNKVLAEHTTALAEQQRRCPGYAYKFFWPSEDFYMYSALQMVVQVYTAMFYKKYRIMELSNSDRSVFFFRPSVESTTLYISRMYTTPNYRPDDTDASEGTVLDCMTNLTRFAMRYVVAYPELLDELAKAVPEPRTRHWSALKGKKKTTEAGIDSRSWWSHGARYYPEDEKKPSRLTARQQAMEKAKAAKDGDKGKGKTMS